MKAQASFIVLLAILLLVAIVVYYAFQGFTPPAIPGDEDKVVREMVEGIITSGTEATLRAMELQGSYLDPPHESIYFSYLGVPYWQYCQHDLSPTIEDVEERFEKSIEFYMNNYTQDIKDFFGKNISLSNVSRVEVNMLDNKVDVDVYMTTIFEGRRVSQPYRVSVPTKFKHIFDFAKDTIVEINKLPEQGGRFFETFTIASLYKSRYLPTTGYLTKCGESIRLTSTEVSQRLEEVIIYTISQFLWWQPMPSSTTYAIERVNGEQYMDIEPLLFLPQGFEVKSDGGVKIENKGWISVIPFPVPYCATAYNIEYSVGYPVIIVVRDPDTGYDFNFAVYVSVDEMEPGECYDIDEPPEFEDPCLEKECSANIVVTDCTGRPLQGAKAYFGDCYIGESDSNGQIIGDIICGTHELYIYHSDTYGYYSKNVPSSAISGTYELCGKPEMTVHFKEFELKDNGYDQYDNPVSCYPCENPADCPSPFTYQSTTCSTPIQTVNCAQTILTSLDTGDPYWIETVDSGGIPEECYDETYARNHPEECGGTCMSTVIETDIPAGDYKLTVDLMDTNYEGVGYLEVDSITISENTQSLTINIPKFDTPTYDPSLRTCLNNKAKLCSFNLVEVI